MSVSFRRLQNVGVCLLIFFAAEAKLVYSQAASEAGYQESIGVPLPTQIVIEAVIQNHIDPPTRQHLVHEVIRGVAVAKGKRLPPDLSDRISRISDVDELYDLLASECQHLGSTVDSKFLTTEAAIQQLNKAVAGGLQVIAQKEQKVNEQLAANRYVGIGVQVRLDSDSERLQLMKVFEGGSGEAAGLRDGDVVMSVDGQNTHQVPIGEVVDWLRGPEGSMVSVSVKSLNSSEAKDFEIVRAVIPLKTVHLIKGVDPEAALIRLDRVTASTVHELRKVIEQLSEHQQTVILDLRSSPEHTLHFLHLLADAILEDTDLGFLESRAGLQPMVTEAGTIFGDRKPVLVYNPFQSQQIAWLASVLQDNGASVYQDPLPRSSDHAEAGAVYGLVRDSVALKDGGHVIRIATARLVTNDQSLFTASRPAGRVIGTASAETSPTNWLVEVWKQNAEVKPLSGTTGLFRRRNSTDPASEQQLLAAPPANNMAPITDATLVQQILFQEKRKAN